MHACTVLSIAFMVLIFCHAGIDVILAQNACDSEPCQHTGTCYDDIPNAYHCDCGATSHTGINCSTVCTDASCITCTDDPSNCTDCFPKFFRTSNWTCQACLDDNCLYCNADTCSQCDIGYYLSEEGGCTNCSLANCVACLNATVCNQCEDFFYWDSSTNNCTSCPANCSQCEQTADSSVISCSSCESGYYINGSSNCLPCGQNCFTCSDGTTCTECATANYLNDSNVCQPCGYLCNDCYNASSCSNCQDGSYKEVESDSSSTCSAITTVTTTSAITTESTVTTVTGPAASTTKPLVTTVTRTAASSTKPPFNKRKCLIRKIFAARKKLCFPWVCSKSRWFARTHRFGCNKWRCLSISRYRQRYPGRCARFTAAKLNGARFR